MLNLDFDMHSQIYYNKKIQETNNKTDYIISFYFPNRNIKIWTEDIQG